MSVAVSPLRNDAPALCVATVIDADPLAPAVVANVSVPGLAQTCIAAFENVIINGRSADVSAACREVNVTVSVLTVAVQGRKSEAAWMVAATLAAMVS